MAAGWAAVALEAAQAAGSVAAVRGAEERVEEGAMGWAEETVGVDLAAADSGERAAETAAAAMAAVATAAAGAAVEVVGEGADRPAERIGATGRGSLVTPPKRNTHNFDTTTGARQREARASGARASNRSRSRPVGSSPDRVCSLCGGSKSPTAGCHFKEWVSRGSEPAWKCEVKCVEVSLARKDSAEEGSEDLAARRSESSSGSSSGRRSSCGRLLIGSGRGVRL